MHSPEFGESGGVSHGWDERGRKNHLSWTALTAAESAQLGALSPKGHGGFLWLWKNSHTWAGVAGDSKRVGGEERGSHRQHGQPALGLWVGSPACFVNKAQSEYSLFHFEAESYHGSYFRKNSGSFPVCC